MNNEKLKQLQHYYIETTPSPEQVDRMWQELSVKLPERQYHKHHYNLRYTAVFAVLTLLFTSSFFAVQAAGPSSPLYPIQEFSQTAVAKISGNYDGLIIHRTDAIINAAQKKSDIEIKKAALEYQKTLVDAQEQKQNKASEKSLKATLKQSEEKLKAVTPTSKEARQAIRESIKATKETQKEVKGSSTGPGNSDQPSNENKPTTPGNSGTNNSGSNNGDNGNNGTNENSGQSTESHGNGNK
jgi:hypothetical protein